MDDFGTGFSSLAYLAKFPFDKVKIDRSFVVDLGKGDKTLPIVQAVISIAEKFGMTAVAEGIETEEQMTALVAEGCSEIQGYLISKPMPAKDVFAFLGVEPKDIVVKSATPAFRETSVAELHLVHKLSVDGHGHNPEHSKAPIPFPSHVRAMPVQENAPATSGKPIPFVKHHISVSKRAG